LHEHFPINPFECSTRSKITEDVIDYYLSGGWEKRLIFKHDLPPPRSSLRFW
jgi:hypothetical protein